MQSGRSRAGAQPRLIERMKLEPWWGWELRFSACPSRDLAPEQGCFSSARPLWGSQGQAEPRLLASLVQHCVPTALLPAAPRWKPGPPHLAQSRGGTPAALPSASGSKSGQSRAASTPRAERIKGAGLWAPQASADPERPGTGEAWTDGAECLAGLSCCCSGAPAPAVSPWTQAPSHGNQGERAAGAQGCPPSYHSWLSDG